MPFVSFPAGVAATHTPCKKMDGGMHEWKDTCLKTDQDPWTQSVYDCMLKKTKTFSGSPKTENPGPAALQVYKLSTPERQSEHSTSTPTCSPRLQLRGASKAVGVCVCRASTVLSSMALTGRYVTSTTWCNHVRSLHCIGT
jgi:hypothetical protein